MYVEKRRRSVIKALSYRLAGSLVMVVIVYLFTAELKLSLKIGGFEFLLKCFLFFLHERLWNSIPFGKSRIRPMVIWMTGLSGAGKTTIGKALCRELSLRRLPCEYLDGDTIRQIFPQTGYTREERDAHIRRVGFLASRLEANGVFVVSALISPYRASRDFVRQTCSNYFEVYVAAPLELCERRDPKGLYAKARQGLIKNFTGIDDPYEPPERPEIVIPTDRMNPQQAAKAILKEVERRIR